ncbi:FAS1-like dehydratase domain-containing protein [Bacillus sp. 2205SS5-2]|uniref:FAS1-like dehydratase domain-containing protein n=1 Tax=Bacillus sp. 2205SS5-2 TaxID=3109031 RepID=UPI0030043C21
MATVKNKVGIVTKPFRFTIERGKILEFVHAIGDRNPLYTDVDLAKEKGYRDIPVPPTFSTVIDMWGGLSFEALISLLEVNPLRVLHGEQSYEYHSTICAGDSITAVMEVIDQRAKSGMKLFTLQTNYFNDEEEIVLVATSVVIER